MSERIYNFSAGPAVLPQPVLERARDELLSFEGSGMSIMEISHRSKRFGRVLERAEAGLRSLLSVPQNYKILFLHGGATLQFSMVPMNLLGPFQNAQYVVTGQWGKKAFEEASRIGKASVVYDGGTDGYKAVPDADSLDFNPSAAYVHYTSNETIDGVEFDYELDAGGVPV